MARGSKSPIPFALRAKRRAAYATLFVEGEIDLSSAPALYDAILEVGGQDPPATIVVDLEGVTFIDSSGVAALVRAHRAMADLGSMVTVGRPASHVRRVLAITGVDSLLGAMGELQTSDSPPPRGHGGSGGRGSAAVPPIRA